MKTEPVIFDKACQTLMIEKSKDAGKLLGAIIHGCATESTHIHVIVSWRGPREWKSMRASIRSAISRALNKSFGKREWFSDSPSRKRVRDHEHFDYLVLEYLPDHHRCWVREEDRQKALARDKNRERPVQGRKKRRRKTK